MTAGVTFPEGVKCKSGNQFEGCPEGTIQELNGFRDSTCECTPNRKGFIIKIQIKKRPEIFVSVKNLFQRGGLKCVMDVRKPLGRCLPALCNVNTDW